LPLLFLYTNSFSQISSTQIDTLSLIVKAFNESDISFLNKFIKPSTGVLVIDYDGPYPIPTFINAFEKAQFIKRGHNSYISKDGEFTSIHFTSYNSNVEFSCFAEYLGDGEFN